MMLVFRPNPGEFVEGASSMIAREAVLIDAA